MFHQHISNVCKSIMAAAASGKVDRPRRSKSQQLPSIKLISMTDLLLGPRKQQSANAVTDRKTISKHRRSSESSSRRLWMMAESVLARTKALEQLEQDCSQGERPHSVSPPNMSIPPKEDANRSLYKILEAALTRVSVLEKRRDICYCCAFKASTGDECIIRGCGSVVSTRHTVRHLRTTSTPQHQVAAMILQQTECLECDKSWKVPSALVHHEIQVHGEAYTSRMEIFGPIFHQTTSCTFLTLIIRQMLANQLKARWMEIVQRSHHIPNHTMSIQARPFPQTSLFLRLPILLLQIPHRHPIPKFTIFHRLLSTTHSRTGLDQTISTPLQPRCPQIRYRSPRLPLGPHLLPISCSRNGLNPMISNPLQTPFSRSYQSQLLSLIRSLTGPNQTTSTPRRSRHSPNPAASHKIPLVASIQIGPGTTTFNIHRVIP